MQSYSRLSQLRKNMVASTICSLVGTLLLAVSYPLYLHAIGYETYGLWLALATVLSFAQLSNLGLGQAVSKLVAADHALDDQRAVDCCVSTALCTLTFTGGLACLCVTIFRHTISSALHLSAANAYTVTALLPAVGLLSVYVVFLDTLSSTLAGIGRMDLYSYTQLVSQLTSVALTLPLLAARQGVVSFIIGNAAGLLTQHVATHFFLRRYLGRNVFSPRSFSFSTLKGMLNISLYLSGCSALNILLSPLSKLLLARFAGLASLPTYDIIVNGCMKLRSLIETAMRSMMPEISRLAATGDHAKIGRLNRKAGRLLLSFGGATFLAIAIICGFAVKLWLGNSAALFPVGGLRIVLLGTFMSLLAVPPYYTLLGLGKSSLLFYFHLLQSSIPVLANVATLLLWHKLTLLGVLAAYALGLFVSSLYLNWENHRVIAKLAIREVASNEVPPTAEYQPQPTI